MGLERRNGFLFYRKPSVISLGVDRVGMWRLLILGDILDADSDPGSLHFMDVVSVACVSEAHAGSIFKDEVSVRRDP
jgi:hypothetical protein